MVGKFFKVYLLALVFSFYFFPSFLRAQQEIPFDNPDQTISLDLQDASMKDIVKIFSVQSGLNFIASEDIQDRRVTLYLDKVPIKDAMDKIFQANNFAYELDRNSNIFIVKDLGPSTIATVTKVFFLKNIVVSSSGVERERSILNTYTPPSGASGGAGGGASASASASAPAPASAGPAGSSSSGGSGLIAAIASLLSEHGKISEDSSTNSIIVTDVPSRMPDIENLIKKLDVPRPQVLLEVEMLDVSKSAVDTIGLKYGQTPFAITLTGASMGTKYPFMSDMAISAIRQITQGNIAVSQGSNTYTVLLEYLKTLTDTKYLARPKILTLNNETAEIKITTNEAVGVKESTSSAGGQQGTTTSEAERYETGVSLRVTPQISLETGEITMVVIPVVAEAKTTSSFVSGGSTKSFSNPEIRTTKSMIRVKDGDTIVIGGLIRNEFTQTETKLPILGDIPVLGALFRHKNKNKDIQRELLVFITPHIVKEGSMLLAQSNKATVPFREQDTLSVYSRQKTIASSLRDLENKGK